MRKSISSLLCATVIVLMTSAAHAADPKPKTHDVGDTVTAFRANALDGKPVNFPGDYKGKIVMLDFWATWCGPCMAEAPHVVAAYKQYHSKGLEILGVSLDQSNSANRVKQVTAKEGMTWRQIYDGKFWDARIAVLYVIRSIPSAYLVDGDTGEILAAGNSLRGDNLAKSIEKALKKKEEKVQ